MTHSTAHRWLATALLFGLAWLLGCPKHAPSDADSVQLRSFDFAWERIRDTYPDPLMRGVDWNALHDELRPAAARAHSNGELQPVLEDMFSRLGDSHFAVISESFEGMLRRGPDSQIDRVYGGGPGSGDPGLDVRLLGDDVVITRVDGGASADTAGGDVHAGLILLSIDDIDIPRLVAELRAEPHDARSFGLLVERMVLAALSQSPNQPVHLRVRDGQDQERAIVVVPRASDAQWVSLGSLPPTPVHVRQSLRPLPSGGQVGVLAFDAFLDPVPRRFSEAARAFIAAGVRGVVLDLRGNTGGVAPMVMGMAGHYVDHAVSLGRLSYRDMPLELTVNPRLPDQRFAGPLAVLVDELSISTAEIMAAGLQQIGRARVFGSTSAGMALPSTWERLPNGDLIQFVTADFTDPSGTRLEGRGVIPDEPCPLSRAALLAGQDPAFDAALRWIESQP